MKRRGDPGYAPNWCVHYRYPDSTCLAGIKYKDCWRDLTLPFAERPCFLDENGQSKPGAARCEELRRPTEKEMQEHHEFVRKQTENLRVAFLGVAQWLADHEGQSVAEVVECPVCAGKLHLSLAASNGHFHGRCETRGCVRWMS